MFDAGYRMLGAVAQGWSREMIWDGRWEGGSCLGTLVHPWRIHVNVWQNQHSIVKYNKVKIKIKKKIPFYTFTKTLGQRFDIQFPLTQIYYVYKSLLFFKQSSCFSDSLRISLTIYYLLPLMCPIVNLWLHCNSCYTPQFTTYLPKSCLPLTSWAHYLLKRLLAIVSLKIPNFYKL